MSDYYDTRDMHERHERERAAQHRFPAVLREEINKEPGPGPRRKCSCGEYLFYTEDIEDHLKKMGEMIFFGTCDICGPGKEEFVGDSSLCNDHYCELRDLVAKYGMRMKQLVWTALMGDDQEAYNITNRYPYFVESNLKWW